MLGMAARRVPRITIIIICNKSGREKGVGVKSFQVS